jgi:cytochrome c oxidase subunit I
MQEQPEDHLPSPSFWPIVLALGLALIAQGVVSDILTSLVGVLVIMVAIAGWALENRAAEQEERHE